MQKQREQIKVKTVTVKAGLIAGLLSVSAGCTLLEAPQTAYELTEIKPAASKDEKQRRRPI